MLFRDGDGSRDVRRQEILEYKTAGLRYLPKRVGKAFFVILELSITYLARRSPPDFEQHIARL